MKAVRIHEDGGPEVLRYEDAPIRCQAPGRSSIELRAASLNHLDVWIRKGLPSVPKPRILGADGAGVVESPGRRALSRATASSSTRASITATEGSPSSASTPTARTPS